MTTLYQTNFDSDANGSLPAGWTNAVGTWVATGVRPVSGVNALASSSAANGDVALYTGVAARADMEVQTDFLALFGTGGMPSISHVVRSDVSCGNQYLMLLTGSGGNTYDLNFLKKNSGTFAVVGSPAPMGVTLTANQVVHIATRIVGSTLSAWAWVGSTRPSTPTLTVTDSSITAAGYGGLYRQNNGAGEAPSADNFVLTDAVSTAPFSITTPYDGRIHQRSGTTGTITSTGTYTGSPASIEARLVLDGTSTVVTGFDWSTKVATPSGSAFSFNFASVPQGGWYNVQIRDSAIPGAVITSGKVGVGALYVSLGQSNARDFMYFGDSSLTPSPLLRVNGYISPTAPASPPFNIWVSPPTATSNGAIAFGNALVAALGIPVGYLDLAVSGTGLGTDWLPKTTTAYTTFINAVTALDGKVEGLYWIQGENDANSGVSQATYYANLTTLFSNIRTDLGQPSLPIALGTLHAITLASFATDANAQAIKNAQVQKCQDANIYRFERADIPVGGDGIHHTAAGFAVLGARVANVFKYIAGLATYFRGPRFASANRVSSTVFDVTITQSAGTDFTPTSGITPWRVLDGSTPIAVSTAVRQSASVVRLNLASAPATLPTVQYFYGINPDISGILKDNSALALPLEFNNGVVATAVTLATTATLTLKNRAGALRTGLTGIKYAFYDQASPDLLLSPLVKAANGTSDASTAVMTVSIAGTSLTPGATGFITALSSDGTLSLAQPVVVA